MGLVQKTRMLWHISTWFLFLSPCWKHEGIYFWYSLWQPGRVPTGKIPKRVGALMTRFRPDLSDLSILSLQQFTNYSSGFLTPVLGPAKTATHEFLLWQVRSLCIHLFASPVLGEVIFPCGVLTHGNGGLKGMQMEDQRKELPPWI